PSVVLPQPDSPTSPSVSPLLMVRLTWSTANRRSLCWPKKPWRIGKLLTRSTVSSRTSGMGLHRDFLFDGGRHPTGGRVARRHFHQRRVFSQAAVHVHRAARIERTADNINGEAGRGAIDGGQALRPIVKPRHSAQQG